MKLSIATGAAKRKRCGAGGTGLKQKTILTKKVRLTYRTESLRNKNLPATPRSAVIANGEADGCSQIGRAMRLHPMPKQPQNAPCGTACPYGAETALRWQDVGGIEGFSLEWMLDRARAPQEALT